MFKILHSWLYIIFRAHWIQLNRLLMVINANQFGLSDVVTECLLLFTCILLHFYWCRYIQNGPFTSMCGLINLESLEIGKPFYPMKKHPFYMCSLSKTWIWLINFFLFTAWNSSLFECYASRLNGPVTCSNHISILETWKCRFIDWHCVYKCVIVLAK